MSPVELELDAGDAGKFDDVAIEHNFMLSAALEARHAQIEAEMRKASAVGGELGQVSASNACSTIYQHPYAESP